MFGYPQNSLYYDLISREYHSSHSNHSRQPNRLYPYDYVRSMSQMTELIGHGGCVNRLDWNESGNLLASASDDTTIRIWRPFEYYHNDKKSVCCIQTDHIRNLFGVRFIPGTNDRFLCSGSMDKLVQIQSIDRQKTIKNYRIHSDRVKDVQISPKQPFIFYSVSEDGTIRRFDIRMEYKQFVQKQEKNHKKFEHLFRRAKSSLNDKLHCKQNGNVIINIHDNNHGNDSDDFKMCETSNSFLKGLSINPIKDYEFSVASGDQYVRVFDVRKGHGLTSKDVMAYVAPPHLSMNAMSYQSNTELKISTQHIHTTFVEYSCDGSQIIVTYHGENVYVFNTLSYDNSNCLKMDNVNNKNGMCEIEKYKKMGNECYKLQKWTKAIEFYQNAINIASNYQNVPLHALYCNLAMCLFQRMHFNDLLLGIFYCDEAIKCNSMYIKAYFWKIKFLSKINDDLNAFKVAKYANKLFPKNGGILREFAKIKKKIKQSKDEKNIKNDADNDDKKEVIVEQNNRKMYQMSARYTGHCNLKTDIKEATFFGQRYICSGSDDGRCFIWDKLSGKLVNILNGVDQEVVNTVRRHPHFPILAMSGIDSTIKIWKPSSVDSRKYVKRHRIPFRNYESRINEKNEEDVKEEEEERDDRMEIDDEFESKMNDVIEENQSNLSDPTSGQIDLSTLLLWAQFMNQQQQ